MRAAIPKLMLVSGVSLWLASAIHFGVPIPVGVTTIYDPFAGARIPEAILGAVMFAGGLYALSGRAGAWLVALLCTTLTVLFALVGTTITVAAAGWGDIVYHAALLTLLGAILVGLVCTRQTDAATVPSRDLLRS